MPSKGKQARQRQKQYFEDAIQRRRSLLVEKGVDKDRIPKDPHLKHLLAELRKTQRRLGAVRALEKQKEDLALRKQQKLEAADAEPPPEAPPEESKKQAKKASKKKQAP